MKFAIESILIIGCIVFGFVACNGDNFATDDDTTDVVNVAGSGGQGGSQNIFDEKHDFEKN